VNLRRSPFTLLTAYCYPFTPNYTVCCRIRLPEINNIHKFLRNHRPPLKFDGKGNYTADLTWSIEGEGTNLPELRTGVYSVSSDGQVSIDGDNIARLGEDNSIGILSNITDTDEWSIAIVLKKPYFKQKAFPSGIFMLLLDESD
jgi:hypothetical protein